MSFASDLRRFRARVEGAHNDLVRAVEIELFRGVIMDSPVDTGRFLGNWQTSITTPAAAVLDTLDPSGSATVGAMTAFVSTLEGGRVTYLANNLPYAERLEYGWSKKAPQGMVRRNMARVQRNVQAQAARHRI